MKSHNNIAEDTCTGIVCKAPLCPVAPNNLNVQTATTRIFKKLGVYLPQKDTEWELPSSAGFYNYGDRYVVSRRWAASTCIWQEGRGYSEVEGGGAGRSCSVTCVGGRALTSAAGSRRKQPMSVRTVGATGPSWRSGTSRL